MTKMIFAVVFAATMIVFAQPAFSESTDPMAQALRVPGAKVTLPVDRAKEAFSPEFVDAARASFNNFHWQMGGDHTLYYNMHMSEFMPTALASPNYEYKPLVKAIKPELGKIKIETKSKGELTLEQYLTEPQFRTQGFMLIHKGKILWKQNSVGFCNIK